MRGRIAILLIALFLVADTGVQTTELVLKDGQRVRCVEVRREGTNYVVLLESGDSLVFPIQLVETVKVELEKDEEEEREGLRVAGDPIPAEVRGVFDRETRRVAGDEIPEGPSGLIEVPTEDLAGDPVRPPTAREQLEVFGEPAEFQKSIIDNSWTPESDWDMDPANNNFAPSTWQESPVASDWQPKSAYDGKTDVLIDSRSTFQKSTIDNSWTPTSGFSK